MNKSFHKNLKRNINLYYIYNIFTAGIFHIPIWISFQSDFMSISQMAFFSALFFVFIFLFELPTGVFADLLGRKISLIAGSILNALSYFYIGFFPSYISMFVFVIVNGIGVSLQSGANQSLVYDTLKEMGKENEYPKVSSRESFLFQFFASFAILAGGYLFLFHKSLPYFLRGFLYLLSIIPAVLMIEPHIDSETFSLQSYIKQTKDGFYEAFKTKHLTKLSILYVVISGVAMSSQRFFTQPYMLEKGFDDVERSWLAFGVKAFIGLLTIFLASRKKLFAHKYFLLLLPVIMGVSMIFAPVFSWPLLIVFLIGIALPSGSRHIFLGYPVQLKLNSKYRATALSTLNMFVSIIYVVVNIAGGLVSEVSSVGNYYFILGLLITFTMIPLTLNIIYSKK